MLCFLRLDDLSHRKGAVTKQNPKAKIRISTMRALVMFFSHGFCNPQSPLMDPNHGNENGREEPNNAEWFLINSFKYSIYIMNGHLKPFILKSSQEQNSAWLSDFHCRFTVCDPIFFPRMFWSMVFALQ